MMSDDLGYAFVPAGPARRVVSLVPSLSESVAALDVLVGVTDYCPPDLGIARIGGTKNPSVDSIVALGPDLVLANEEENRESDLAALRNAGVPVWVTRIRSVDEAFASLRRLFAVALRVAPPPWLAEAEAAWANPHDRHQPVRAGIPIWRRPWMVLGRDTFAGDVLARLGVENAFGAADERYPKVALADLQDVDMVVLPDEPYAFSATDGPECFPGLPVALVSGRHLTWYGPSLVEAPSVLAAQLAAARPYA